LILPSNIGTHYSYAMNPRVMTEWANETADRIKCLLNNIKEHPILIYSGMSGINHAAYLSRSLYERDVNFDQFYLRKNEERKETHGNAEELSSFHIHCEYGVIYIFVDDFIDRGNTFKRVLKAAQSRISVAKSVILATMEQKEIESSLAFRGILLISDVINAISSFTFNHELENDKFSN